MHLARNRGSSQESPQPSRLYLPPGCTHPDPPLLSPNYHSQLLLAVHHLLQEAFVDWKSGPSHPPDEGSGHTLGGKSRDSSLAISVAPRAHSRPPNSHTASRSLPTPLAVSGKCSKDGWLPATGKVTAHSLWTVQRTLSVSPPPLHNALGCETTTRPERTRRSYFF